jgi:hypothetical protein
LPISRVHTGRGRRRGQDEGARIVSDHIPYRMREQRVGRPGSTPVGVRGHRPSVCVSPADPAHPYPASRPCPRPRPILETVTWCRLDDRDRTSDQAGTGRTARGPSAPRSWSQSASATSRAPSKTSPLLREILTSIVPTRMRLWRIVARNRRSRQVLPTRRRPPRPLLGQERDRHVTGSDLTDLGHASPRSIFGVVSTWCSTKGRRSKAWALV